MMQPSRDSPFGPSGTQSSGLSSPNQQTSAFRQNLEPEPARNDPWSVPPRSTEASEDAHQSAASEDHQSDEFFIDVRLKRSGCGFMSCLTACTSCFRRRRSGGRQRLRDSSEGGSSMTMEEERAYLMQCDQLGLESWGRDDDADDSG